MSSFMDRLTGRKPTPAQSAKDRLKLVLVTDRTTISPEDLRKMQTEILDVIRKYCRINEDAVDMKFEQRDRENYLVADIPLAAGRPDEPLGSVRLETTITSEDPPTQPKKEDQVKEDKAEKPAEVSATEATTTEETKSEEDVSPLEGDTLKLTPIPPEEAKAEESLSEEEKKKEDD